MPDGALGSLAQGERGQILSVDEHGGLTWVNPASGVIDDIPIATGVLVGGVRSSTPALLNSVAVDTSGTMTVNSLDVAKLYVKVGDEWVLRAGTAQE